ncbi:hypothetical protein [Candidatus Epulonipiscium viviparus]|uniref:hypothetical protein n=1 Tax=Candidatus Epulonipiscium viviparus TaxID=420336 RepID=UPI0027380BDD|nr:hypothetical protein [Candidatus Epulopiscium viviparus]
MRIAPTDVILVGFNMPHKSLFDGDFNEKGRPSWRLLRQSDFWLGNIVSGNLAMGLSFDRLSSGGNAIATYTTKATIADTISKTATIKWRFAAQAEYECDAYVSLSLVCNNIEVVLADKIEISRAPTPAAEYEGEYAADITLKNPKVKLTLYSNFDINVYVEWVDVAISETTATWDVAATDTADGIALSFNQAAPCDIYRSNQKRTGYVKIATEQVGAFIDTTAVCGKTYYYSVRLSHDDAASPAYPVIGIKPDDGISIAPTNLVATGSKWEVTLSWDDANNDTEFYNIYRADSITKELSLLHYHHSNYQKFVDMLPIKGSTNTYSVSAIDFCGNESPLSAPATAIVSAIPGASFSDLIQPLPVTKTMVNAGIWGASYVLPRDKNNGIEDNEYSYWGGRIVEEAGKYHINIVRWPENTRRGHWDWPSSTTAYATSTDPLGPYKVSREKAYTYTAGVENLNSSGHNTNIILRNDGSYLLYTLVNFTPILLSSKSISGPWKYEGEMKVNHNDSQRAYRYERNLSGVELEDGSLLFVSKAGNMIKSTSGILGPYEVLTGTIQENTTVPERYRKSVYEDPVMWKDELQYHMIINGFIDFRAIYLRSADGINWFYEDGFAYTSTSTVYENGVRTLWHKIERPNVLVDKYGRATHLSMAVIDINKANDYPNDNHSSKNQILPLIIPRRLRRLSETEILILDEDTLVETDSPELAATEIKDNAPANTINDDESAHTIEDDASAHAIKDDASANTINDDESAHAIEGDDSANTINDAESANAIEDDASAHAIENDSSANTIEDDSSAHAIKDDASAHAIEGDDSANTIEDHSSTHAFENDSSANTINDDDSANTIKGDVSANAIKGDDSANAINDDASANVIGRDSSDNAVRSDASAHAVGSDSSANAINGDVSAHAIENDSSANAINGDVSAHAIENDASAHAIENDSSANAINDDASAHAIKDDDSARTINDAESAHAIEDDASDNAVEGDVSANTIEDDSSTHAFEGDVSAHTIEGDASANAIEDDASDNTSTMTI